MINNFELNLKHLLYVYKIKRKEKYSFKLNINDDKYYNQIDLLIDEKEIIKYKKIDIKGIKGKIEKIKENINLNDMNEYIQYFKNLSGIYFEEEFQKYNFLNIIEQFNNLKYINLRIGYIEDSNNILFNIIKNSQNLKSLILRLEPNQNINLFLQIIQNLKYLRILNISGININLNEILAQYPKLKNKLYYFKEFKIGNQGFIFKNKKNVYYDIKCKYNFCFDYREVKLFGNNEEINKNCKFYLNNKRINNLCKKFPEYNQYILTIIFMKELKDMNLIFSECSSIISLNLSNFKTDNVENMSGMFFNCSSLTSLNLSNFNTINVNKMNDIFSNCSSLTSLDLSHFNTNNVDDISGMFYNCSSLNYLNLSNFNTNNVKDLSYMFYKCSSLTSLDLSNFNTINVNNMSEMFYNCSSLTSLNLSNFNTNNVNDMYGMFCNCSSLTSLNLSNFNTNNVYNMNNMFYQCSSLTLFFFNFFKFI